MTHRAQRERLARIDPLGDGRRHAGAPHRRSTLVIGEPTVTSHLVHVDSQLEAPQEPLLQLHSVSMRDEPLGDRRPHAGQEILDLDVTARNGVTRVGGEDARAQLRHRSEPSPLTAAWARPWRRSDWG